MYFTRPLAALVVVAVTAVKAAPGPSTSLTKRWCGFPESCPCKPDQKTQCELKYDECGKQHYWPAQCEGCAPCLELCVDRPAGFILDATNASDWLERTLPAFNSLAIESQLPQLDPTEVSDNIVALNDDQFMMLPHPPSAFHTTLYGPVFRMDPNLLVGGNASGSADGDGEWRSLGWSAHLLDERFGTRKRPYINHNARALSLPLLHELTLAFGEYFATTPLSQFRGAHNVAREYEVNTIFMATHYVLERHREALLWSWVVAKWGGSFGVLDRYQKWRMWRELGGGDADGLVLRLQADRTTSDDVETNLRMAGVQPPRSMDPKRQADVAYSWLSMDGFSADFHTLPKRVELKRSECIRREAELAWNMFRRVLIESPTCGDRIIAALIHTSKSGLGVFLPPPSTSAPTDLSAKNPTILPLQFAKTAPPLPPNPRAFAVRLFMRYAHVLGNAPAAFAPMHSISKTAGMLKKADKQKNLTLMCLNDDLADGDQTGVNILLREWFEKRWPEKLKCEL
ncbi:hypothetical protein C8R46DRAFT_1220823 [Mycena filopes]|nr:hypothetical protein C8R46DRAFT_1220823 [Mycena filopes]